MCLRLVQARKGLKISHLPVTLAFLEVLLAYGDDLLQGDKLGRSLNCRLCLQLRLIRQLFVRLEQPASE